MAQAQAKPEPEDLFRKPRNLLLDTVPEMYPYRDDGCEVAPACLRCPLPRCKFDNPGWYQKELRDRRDQRIAQARSHEGLTVIQLSQPFGVSQRTVFRALQSARAGASSH
jgi:hypothetical protein